MKEAPKGVIKLTHCIEYKIVSILFYFQPAKAAKPLAGALDKRFSSMF